MFERSSALGLRLLLFLIVSIALMGFDHRRNSFAELRMVLSTVVSPIQYAVDLPIQLVAWLQATVISHESLRQENAQLQAEQILLRAELQRILALEKENRQLRALLQSTSRIGGDTIVAQLLAVEASPFDHQIILDKGTRHGVYIGQPVFDATGVMGQVIEVAPFTSRVLLVTDNKSALPVQVDRNGIRGVVQGTGSINAMALVNIPVTADIRVGDLLVTSGLGRRFPEGYPVGVVSSRVDQSGEEFATITVTPSAQLNRSRLTLLVWPPILEQEFMEELDFFLSDDEVDVD